MTPDVPGDNCGAPACYSDDHSGGSGRITDAPDGITPYLEAAHDIARSRRHAAFEQGERTAKRGATVV